MRLCFHNRLSNEQSGCFVGKNVQYFLLLESIFYKDQMSGPKSKRNEGKVKQNVIRKSLTKALHLVPFFFFNFK